MGLVCKWSFFPARKGDLAATAANLLWAAGPSRDAELSASPSAASDGKLLLVCCEEGDGWVGVSFKKDHVNINFSTDLIQTLAATLAAAPCAGYF